MHYHLELMLAHSCTTLQITIVFRVHPVENFVIGSKGGPGWNKTGGHGVRRDRAEGHVMRYVLCDEELG